jgi:PST family polysaccharide transporter
MAFRLPSLAPFAWITVEKLTQQILWVILFSILAPILGPRPYGLFSLVMVFVGICEYILIDGATEALVTVRELDHLHTGTANLSLCLIAFAMSLVICGLAPFVGLLLHDDQIAPLMWGMAPLPLLSALSAAPIAIMKRALQFKKLAVRSIAGLMLGGIFGIILALAGFGVWALALQIVAQRLAEVTIAWFSVPDRLGFAWSRARFAELRPIGQDVFAGRVMMFAAGQLPRVIIGYGVGPTELGLFTLAIRFVDIILFTAVMPITSVGRIELRHSVPGSPQFGRTFSAMVQNVSFLAFPCMLGMAALAPELFRVWLDQRWAAGVVPTQLILLGGVPLALCYCIDSALLGAGMSSLFRRVAAIQAASVIGATLVGAMFGLNTICVLLAVRPWILLPLLIRLVNRACHLAVGNFLGTTVHSLIGAVLMLVVLNLPFVHPSWQAEKFNLVSLVLIGVAVYGAFSYGFARGQLRSFFTGIFVRRP